MPFGAEPLPFFDPERTFCEATDDSNWSEQAVNGDVAVPATMRNRPHPKSVTV
jgi:hypothetical protein